MSEQERRAPSSSDRDLIQAALEDAQSLGSRTSRTALAGRAIPGYEILREVHRGGQGVVYEAVHLTTKRRVAIKALRHGVLASDHDRARFEREVELLSQIDHPNIVVIHDTGEADGLHYHVMDFIEGDPLDRYLAGRELPPDGALRLFQRICDAVSAAHLRGVIHRDLKPANILIDAKGEPHILDFGLARLAADQANEDSPVMTITGQFVGSLPWASPEQAEGLTSKIDIRSDVYSLGVILYQMLTGQFPYEVVGAMRDVLENILHRQPARPSTVRRGINNEIETIVLKCLSKERERRYQSAGEVARDVGHYLTGEPIEARRDSGWYVMRKTLLRHRAAVSVAAAFLLLVLGSSVALGVMYRDANAQRALAIEQRDKVNESLRQAEAMVSVLSALIEIPDPTWIGPDPYATLEDASAKVAREFADDPALKAELLYALSIGYHQLLNIHPALAIPASINRAAAAANIRRKTLGDEHPLTVRSIVQTANMIGVDRRYDEAAALLDEALAIVRNRESLDEDELVTVQIIYAALYRDTGRIQEAIDTLEEVLRTMDLSHPPRHSKYQEVYTMLTYLYSYLGRFHDALEVIERLEQSVQRDEAGDDDPRILWALSLRYQVHAASGRMQRAAEVNQRFQQRIRQLREQYDLELRERSREGGDE